MGDFFEDLGKRITETAEAVTRKTEEVVGVQKIKNQIRVLQRKNESDFQEIGQLIYDKFKSGEVLDTKYIDLCVQIEKREDEIEEALKEAAVLRGKDICPNCKNHLEPDMLYCPKCGTKVEEDIFEEESEEETAEEEDAEVKESE